MQRIVGRLENLNAYIVVAIYVIVSIVYILLSDVLLMAVDVDTGSTLLISLVKGFLFVLLTGLLILLLIRWSDRKLILSQRNVSQLSEEMQQREIASQLVRLESIGNLAAGLAHNLNNTLTVIEGNLSVIKEKCHVSEDAVKHLDAIEGAVDRGRGLSQTLLSFSQGGEPLKELVDLRSYIPEYTAFTLGRPGINVAYDLPKDLMPVMADRGQLPHLFNNILMNAVEAVPDGGSVTVTGRNAVIGEGEVAALKAGDYVRIVVQDTGPGIPRPHIHRIFDPYFSTKGQTRGLGLTVAQNIARRHSGVILASSKEGGGTSISVLLPVSKELPDQPIEFKRRTVDRRKVLWMDDEEAIREVGKELLEQLGYEAQVARDGQEALMLFQEALPSAPFSVVILDLVVPEGMGGEETLDKLMRLDPQVRTVVCSGYSSNPVMANHVEHGFSAVLPKPFKLEALDHVLRDLMP